MLTADANVGRIVAWAALLLLVAALLWYRSALLGWWPRLRETRRRVLAEDTLKYIHNRELAGQSATLDSLGGALALGSRATVALVARLEARGWLHSSAGGLSLTAEGVRLALQVIRAHRLWERYLVDEARMPVAAVHAEAERREHTYTSEQLDALEAAMGHPATDPHGDPIPTARGELPALEARAISEWPPRTPARIVHLEDEPPAVFAQIAAEGLHPGQVIWMLEADARRIVLSDGQDTHTLAPVVGANIFVAPVEEPEARAGGEKLTCLKPGQRATVRGLDRSLQGYTRRRLLDLGLTPGVQITAEMSGIFRDPVAYRVRGSLIALRRDQAEHVLIDRNGQENARHG